MAGQTSSPSDRRYPLVDQTLPPPPHPLPPQDVDVSLVHFQRGEGVPAWVWRTLYEYRAEWMGDAPHVSLVDGETPLVLLDLRDFERLVNDRGVTRAFTRAGDALFERLVEEGVIDI